MNHEELRHQIERITRLAIDEQNQLSVTSYMDLVDNTVRFIEHHEQAVRAEEEKRIVAIVTDFRNWVRWRDGSANLMASLLAIKDAISRRADTAAERDDDGK